MAFLRRALSALVYGLTALLVLPPLARAEALIALRLTDAPHAPADAPDVIAHIPTRLETTEPVQLVIFLHGFSSCVRALVASEPTPCISGGPPQRAYGLARIHEQAASNSVLLVPQLAFLTRDAHAARFEQPGGFDAFLKDVRAKLANQLEPALRFASVTLVAHSAGYKAAATILDDPTRSTAITNLVLFDALYAHWDVFAAFVRGGPKRRLISLYTHDRATTRGNRNLTALLQANKKSKQRSALGQLRQECVSTPHGLIPSRHFAEILAELF